MASDVRFFRFLIVRYGENINIEMLIIINNSWNGARVVAVVTTAAADALDAPIIIPTIVEKNVPAHIGHAVNKPVVAPPIPPG